MRSIESHASTSFPESVSGSVLPSTSATPTLAAAIPDETLTTPDQLLPLSANVSTHKSSDYKLSAVKYYLTHSKNQVQTCKIFGCSTRSLMRWVDKYKSTNNITRKKRNYTSYKIANSHILFIKQQLKQNKTITMDELSKTY